MIIFGVLLFFMFLAIFEIPRLIREKYWRELVVFAVFYCAAFGLSVLYALGIKIPSPEPLMVHLIEDVLHLKY